MGLDFLLCGVIASIALILFTICIDSWFWTRLTAIKWPEFEVFYFNAIQNESSKWGTSPWHHYFFPIIPKMLLINSVFMFFALFKINPFIFLNELKKKKQSNLWHLFSSFIDWESVQLFFICTSFIFCYSFLPHKEVRFIFFIIAPCTLLSTIGCIRLLTFWGFRGFTNATFSMLWFRQNLQQRQEQLHYLWIPNHLLLCSIVKRFVSIKKPKSFGAICKYLKSILYELPIEIYKQIKLKIYAISSVYHFFIDLLLPFVIFLGISTSACIACYGVYEASYNYPGGVAITLFPKIV